jgi:uncharacterized protein (DUF2141 family)
MLTGCDFECEWGKIFIFALDFNIIIKKQTMFLHIITVLSMLILEPNPIDLTPKSGSILLNVSNIRSNTGKVNISLFATSDGFPSSPEKATAIQSVTIQNNQVSVRFENIPFGTYAIACHHDENGNGKMDTNLLGIPKEGYGTSNNAVNRFSAPKFSEAKFPFDAAVLSVNIKMFYW